LWWGRNPGSPDAKIAVVERAAEHTESWSGHAPVTVIYGEGT